MRTFEGQTAKTVSLTNDQSGNLLARRGSLTSHGATQDIWYRLAGRELGGISNNGTQDVTAVQAVAQRTADPDDGPFRGGSTTHAAHADFDRFYTPVNSFRQGSGGGAYTVQAGDTLRSVASAVYGDSQLWYLIAGANGLAGEAGLAEGATIILPAGVTRNTNRADTFQPFNPADAIGDTSPAIPQPGRGNQCGILGQILLAVVAVAVTIATQGAASGFFAGAFGAQAGVVSTASIAAGAAGGAVSAAAGSIVSQGLGVATGIQDKFSFKSVGLAAIGGFIGAGNTAAFGSPKDFIAAGIRGATNNALTQGIGVATGLQNKFSFAGVAAAGVGAAVSHSVGRNLPGAAGRDALPEIGIPGRGARLDNIIASNTAGGIANAATRSALTGTSFGDSFRAAIPDIISGAVGDALGAARQTAAFEKALQSRAKQDKVARGEAKAEAALVIGKDAILARRPTAPDVRAKSQFVITDTRTAKTETLGGKLPSYLKPLGQIAALAIIADRLATIGNGEYTTVTFSDGDLTFDLTGHPDELILGLTAQRGGKLLAGATVSPNAAGDLLIRDFESFNKALGGALDGAVIQIRDAGVVEFVTASLVPSTEHEIEIVDTLSKAGVSSSAIEAELSNHRGRVEAAILFGRSLDRPSDRIINFSRPSLQHNFARAKIFGVVGNQNNSTLRQFEQNLKEFVTSPDTTQIQGTLRRHLLVSHFINLNNGLSVTTDRGTGLLLTSGRLSPDQLRHVLTDGNLGGSK